MEAESFAVKQNLIDIVVQFWSVSNAIRIRSGSIELSLLIEQSQIWLNVCNVIYGSLTTLEARTLKRRRISSQ